MSEHIQSRRFEVPHIDISLQYTALPRFLARRLLREDEQVTWVRGPRLNPWWERFVTHIGLFVLALMLGALFLGIGRLIGGSWSAVPAALGVATFIIIIGSVYVLAIANAYFTRLVVTNFRLMILQGHEVCRSWSIDDLPPSLIHHDPRAFGWKSRIVNVDALQTMLGGASEHFADPKTIRALGKHLDQIKGRGKP